MCRIFKRIFQKYLTLLCIYGIIESRKGGEHMGMTDKQFNAFLRRLIKGVMDILKAKTVEEKNEKTKELLDELQKDLED